MRYSKYIFLCFISMISMFHVLAQKATKGKRPNVILLLVDDFGWKDIHAYGSAFYETPNMDALIQQSLKFTQAYATYPRCVPSRYSIMTGTHPARLKGDGEGNDGESAFTIRAPQISIGQMMQQAGYYTFYVGKWHLGSGAYGPQQQGFDRSVAAGEAGATSSHFAPYNISRGNTSGKEKPIPDLDNAPDQEYLADRLTDETIQLIQKNAAAGKPFFGVLAHYAVHTPIQAKEEYKNYFKQKLSTMPVVAGPEYEPESAGENKLKQNNFTYAAMIKSVDESVGRIVAMLKQLGLEKETMVIVTSDHGGLSARGNNRELATSNRPLRAGKGHLYEGGIRVPLFIKWPGVVAPGTETNAMVQGLDLYPTLMDVVGSSRNATQTLDGKSFYNVLKGGLSEKDRLFFWHNGAPRPVSTADIYSSAIRVGDYKLIDFFASGKVELYDIKNDLQESKDLSTAMPERTTQMLGQLNAWRKNIGADMRLKPNGMSVAEKELQGKQDPAQEQRRELRKQERKAIKN